VTPYAPHPSSSAAPTGSLSQYLRFLWRRKISLILPVVVAVGTGFVVSSGEAKQYASYTDLLFTPTTPVDGSQARTISIPTEARIAVSPAVLGEAAKTLKKASLPGSVTAAQSGDVLVMRIDARSTNPVVAASVVNAVAKAYLAERMQQGVEAVAADTQDINARLGQIAATLKDLNSQLAANLAPAKVDVANGLRSQINQLNGEQQVQQTRLYQLSRQATGTNKDVSVLVPGTVNGTPVSPKPLRSAATAGLVGLLAGLGLALLRERLANSLQRLDDIEGPLGAPMLSVIPALNRRTMQESPVTVLSDPTSAASEAYRILRNNLTVAGVTEDVRVLMVSSSLPGEGKSTTAANLAAAFAETGIDTVLVDADVRRPNVHNLMEMPNDAGVTGFLKNELDRFALIQVLEANRVSDNLVVLPAGPALNGPAQLVTRPKQFAALIAALREDYLVIVDAPPTLPVADAGTIATAVDGVVVVVRPDLVSRAVLAQLAGRLRQLHAPVLGAVINAPRRSSFESGAGKHGYSYGYGNHSPQASTQAGSFSKLVRSGK
jgi:succinoglycan biosynthesis transport protein ExoP